MADQLAAVPQANASFEQGMEWIRSVLKERYSIWYRRHAVINGYTNKSTNAYISKQLHKYTNK